MIIYIYTHCRCIPLCNLVFTTAELQLQYTYHIYIYILTFVHVGVYMILKSFICFTSSEKNTGKKQTNKKRHVSSSPGRVGGRRRVHAWRSSKGEMGLPGWYCWWKKFGVHQVEGKVVYRIPFFTRFYASKRWLFGISSINSIHDKLKYSQLQKSVLLVRLEVRMVLFGAFSTGTRFLACKLMILWQLLWMNGTRAQRSHGILSVTSLNPNNLTTEPVWAAHALPQQDTSRILQDLLKDESDIYGFPPWPSGIYKHWIHWRLEGDSWFVSQLAPAIEQGKSMLYFLVCKYVFFSSYFLIT